MRIPELKKGNIFTTPKGKTEYEFIGKMGNEKEGYYYLTTRANSNGKSGFWSTKDIEIEYVLPF